MSGSNTPFNRAGKLLEEGTQLTGPQARGVLRLSIKDAGFDARTVGASELAVICERLVPNRLLSQGVDGGTAESLGQNIAAALRALGAASAPIAAASMFDRLDGARLEGD